MRMITISRQFGSGGRELGKRLAERLNWDYYDREILTGRSHGEGGTFDLTVNTTNRDIKSLTEALEAFALRWFEG